MKKTTARVALATAGTRTRVIASAAAWCVLTTAWVPLMVVMRWPGTPPGPMTGAVAADLITRRVTLLVEVVAASGIAVAVWMLGVLVLVRWRCALRGYEDDTRALRSASPEDITLGRDWR